MPFPQVHFFKNYSGARSRLNKKKCCGPIILFPPVALVGKGGVQKQNTYMFSIPTTNPYYPIHVFYPYYLSARPKTVKY